MKTYGKLDIRNCDCMELMRGFPDGHFDLAIVDPPYGIGKNWRKDRKSKFYRHETKYGNERIPGREYFVELARVSRGRIVFGGNYYTRFLKPTNAWIVWNKHTSDKIRSEGELAWTSFARPLRIVDFYWNGANVCEQRPHVHPHEKPVALYHWLLREYAKPGQRILDTHLGSGSIAVACHYFGADLTACELDGDYHRAAMERIRRDTAQEEFL